MKVHMGEAELAGRFEDAVYHIEHHNQDLNFVGKYALSELPRQHGYKVVLTGEGADEQFAGYPTYLPDYLREPDGWLKMEDEKRAKLVTEHDEAIKAFYQALGGTTRYFGPNKLNSLSTPAWMLAFTPPLAFFAPWVRDQFSSVNALDTVTNNLDGIALDRIMRRWHPLHSALYVWTKGHLANQFLSCLGDRVEMAHSVEARTPFLDHVLSGYVNSLPPNLKIRADGKGGYIEKFALREAVRPFVTTEIYERRKHAYAAPTQYSRDGPIRILLDRLITRDNVEALGFLDWEVVREMMGNAFGDADVEADADAGVGANGHARGNVNGDTNGEGNVYAWRMILIVAEWVVLCKRFGVKRAVVR